MNQPPTIKKARKGQIAIFLLCYCGLLCLLEARARSHYNWYESEFNVLFFSLSFHMCAANHMHKISPVSLHSYWMVTNLTVSIDGGFAIMENHYFFVFFCVTVDVQWKFNSRSSINIQRNCTKSMPDVTCFYHFGFQFSRREIKHKQQSYSTVIFTCWLPFEIWR